MQTVETLNEGLKRAYTLTISAKDIDARVDSEVANIAPQVRMPGFRPGKVPANLIRKMHGERLQADALNSSIQEGVQKVIADNKLRPRDAACGGTGRRLRVRQGCRGQDLA
jgi:trigger factor